MKFEKYPFEKLNELLKGITPKEKDEINLTIGEPQFETPSFIKDEIIENIDLIKKYPKSSGEKYLKEALIKYNKERFGIQLEEDEIIPTFGTREVLFNFPQFLLYNISSPHMAFTNPFYQIYEGAAIASKAKITYINLEEENGFKPAISEDKLKEIDFVILNFPNNPTASTLDINELRWWVRASREYDFYLLNDECYIDLYFDEKIPSLLEASILEGNRDFKKIFVVNSASKRSSAPGLRSGYIAGDKEVLKSYMRYRTYIGCASPLMLQKGAAAAWEDLEHPKEFVEVYKRNFDLAKEILKITPPKATFYIWLRVKDDLEFTKRVYEEYNIKVLPGRFLGRDEVGEGFIRIALVYRPEIIEIALKKIKRVIDEEY